MKRGVEQELPLLLPPHSQSLQEFFCFLEFDALAKTEVLGHGGCRKHIMEGESYELFITAPVFPLQN